MKFMLILGAFSLCFSSLFASPIFPEHQEDFAKKAIPSYSKISPFYAGISVEERPAFSNSSTNIDALKYSLELDIHKDKAEMLVKQNIILRAKEDLLELQLDASPGISISLVSSDRDILLFEHADSVLKVKFRELVARKQEFSIQVSYKLNLLDNKAITAVKSEEGDLIQFSTMTEPLMSRDWIVSVDRPEDKVLYEVIATVPDSWSLMSNGKAIHDIHDENNSVYHWQMNHPIPTYLISLVAGVFNKYNEDWNGLPLSYWYDHVATEKAVELLKDTPKHLDYFDKKLLRYPFDKYNVTSAIDFPGAMEHTTATSFNSSLFHTDHAMTTIVHELAHHWFGDLVTMRFWDDLWLNESFATFIEIDYIRETESHENYINFNDTFRSGYLSQEPINGQLGPIVNYENTPPAKFNSVSYDKGGVTLNYLREILTDDIFFKALRSYLSDPALAMGSADTSDLKKHLEKVSGNNLERFFEQFIFRKGHIDLQIIQDSTYSFRFIQKQAESIGLYDLYIPVDVIFTDLSTRRIHIWVDEASQTYSLPQNMESEGETKAVLTAVFDPNRALPGVLALDYQIESAWTILNSKVASSLQFRLVLRDLASKGELTYKDWERIFEDHRGQAHHLKSIIKVGYQEFSNNNEMLDLTIGFAGPAYPLEMRQGVIEGLQHIAYPNPVVEKNKSFLLNIFRGKSDRYGIEAPLAFILGTHKFPIEAELRDRIEKAFGIGSFYYGSMLKGLLALNPEAGLRDFTKELRNSKLHYRGRTAWAMSLIKTSEVANSIGRELLEQHLDEGKESYDFCLKHMVGALDSIHNDEAKDFLQEFIADPKSTRSWVKYASEIIANW